MLPRYAGWAVAALIAVATATAATEHPPRFATVLGETSLDVAADTPAGPVRAEAQGGGGAPRVAIDPPPLASEEPSPGPAAPSEPQENETAPTPEPGPNGTAQEPPVPATNNTTRIAPPTLSPRHQSVDGRAGTPTSFFLEVANGAEVAQNVTLTASAPLLWSVTLTPKHVWLEPGETARLEGTITIPPLVGMNGTVVVTATGASASDAAYVEACLRGELLDPCAPPPSLPPRNDTRPPSNHTPPANGTSTSNETSASNETPEEDPTPPAQETSSTPPADEPEEPAPTAEAPAPPANGTAPSETDPAPPPSEPPASAGAEATVTVEARVEV